MAPEAERGHTVVGRKARKLDALALATGRAEYTDDIDLPDMLHVRLLTSPHAHARVRAIDTSKAEALPGVHLVLCHRNVPRVLHTTAGQGAPEPSPYDTVMFDTKVRYLGDRVAAVAAETPAIAEEALGLIAVDYEVLPAVLDPRQAMVEGAPVIHDEPDARILIPVPYEPKRNHAAHVDVEVGDVERGLAEAEIVLDAEYETPYVSHGAIEPHIAIAWLDPHDRLIIRTSTQVPFHVRRICAQVLGIPLKRIRVIKPRVGGGFGGKQEIFLEYIAGLVALRTRRPARLRLSREEVFSSSRTRHPQILRLRSGLRRDGTITALDLRILMNTGAYGSHALTVVCNSGSKSLPLFNKVPNIRFVGDTVYTNLPVAGACRAYGAPQSSFALGCQADEMAHAVGMDPLDFYRMHHIREGETSPIFQALGEGRVGVEMVVQSCGLDRCIDLGAEAFGWRERRGRNLGGTEERRRGAGMVCLLQGSSIPTIDMGAATIKMNEDGSFNLLIGATDIGTGSDTILAQIAAEVLGVAHDDLIVYSSDTDLTPFDVGAYASSTTYLTGMAVKKAAEQVRDQIRGVAAAILGAPAEGLTLAGGRVTAPDGRSVSLSKVGHRSLYEHDQFQIIGSASHLTEASPPPFSAQFAEVEVDTRTGKVTVLRYVTTVDCGTAINPELAEGQTEGGVLNGIGYALYEEMVLDAEGRVVNGDFRGYKMPGTADLPEMRTILVPTWEPTGPFGAKSVSEIAINGPMPAIANAIFDAVGIRLRRPPFTPERVLAALDTKREAEGR